MLKQWLACVSLVFIVGLIIFNTPALLDSSEPREQPNVFSKQPSNGARSLRLGEDIPSEAPTPGDHISPEQITVYEDKIVIDLGGRKAVWSTYTPSGSMLPVFTEGHNGIEIIPQCPDEIHVGDIIAYEFEDLMVVHRVIKTAADNLGWYAITKGDNNDLPDPLRVRCDMIKRLTIGILF